MTYQRTTNQTNVRELIRFLSMKQAGEFLNVSRSKLNNIINDGDLKSVKIGASRKIAEDELLRYQNELLAN